MLGFRTPCFFFFHCCYCCFPSRLFFPLPTDCGLSWAQERSYCIFLPFILFHILLVYSRTKILWCSPRFTVVQVEGDASSTLRAAYVCLFSCWLHTCTSTRFYISVSRFSSGNLRRLVSYFSFVSLFSLMRSAKKEKDTKESQIEWKMSDTHASSHCLFTTFLDVLCKQMQLALFLFFLYKKNLLCVCV